MVYGLSHNDDVLLTLGDETYQEIEDKINSLARQLPDSIDERVKETCATKVFYFRKAAGYIIEFFPEGELHKSFRKIFLLHNWSGA